VRRRILLFLAGLGIRYPRRIFVGSAMVAVATVLLFVLKPPVIQSDVLDLLPRDAPVVKDFRDATRDFKSLDYLFILLKTDDPVDHPAQSYEEFADLMAERLRKSGRVEGVDYRLQDYRPILDTMLPRALLYLSPENLEEVAGALSDAGIRDQVSKNRELLSNPASFLTKDLIRLDPFGLLRILGKQFSGKATQIEVDASDGYYASRDASALLLIVRPKKPAQDLPFSKALMAEVRNAEAAARTALAADGGGDDLRHLAVKYGGGYPIAQSDFKLILRDAVLNTVSSLALVLFIYMWAFRRKSSLAYGWVPLLFGMLVTFGVVHLMGVTLNSATAGFGALLIGLGIDFPTVLYGRYVEERNRGVEVGDAIRSAMGNPAPSVLTGALTTAATFAAMFVTHFPGMHQVAILTGVGILLCALSVFLLLPAMLQANHLRARKSGVEPVFHMHVFGFEKLATLAHRRPVATLATTGLLTLGLLYAATGITVDDNIQNLRSKSNEGIEVSLEVAKTFGASLSYMMALVEGSTPDEIVSRSEKVVEAAKPFVDRKEILFADSLSTYLPPAVRQREVMARLAAGSSSEFDPARICRSFTEASIAGGFEPSYFTPSLAALPAMVAPAGPVTFGELMGGPAAPLISKYIVEKKPGHYRGVVYLFIPENLKNLDPEKIGRSISAAVPGTKVVGVNLLGRFLREMVATDAARAFLVGMLLVLLLIALGFRDLFSGFLSLVPLALGMVWMLGTMSLLGLRLDIMNIFVTTMILGVGSDYGIYIVHRFREGGGRDIPRLINESAKPVAIAALTTVAGFGSMSISSYPGLRSMGYVSLLGTLFCMLTTLTVLVALLTLVARRRDRGKAGQAP
jgi:uncharacterized protein